MLAQIDWLILIATLPARIRDEAAARMDRFRKKKLQGPLAWSPARWEETTAKLGTLAAEFPEDAPPTSSPVGDY